MKQNLYQILGVPQNASQSVLDAAYTELLTKHKERHDPGAQDIKNELVIIKWAYDILSNADKRAAYDVKLEAMPVKPRIVHPTPKVSPQPATENQHVNEEAQTDTTPLQLDGASQSRNDVQVAPKDDVQAAQWYRKAADQGDALAQRVMGTLYFGGMGVPQDDELAAQWFRNAADKGDAHAQSAMGTLYFGGMGVPQDDELAAQWFRKAADQGDAHAQNAMGILYSSGKGVPKDDELAAQWFRKAADQGDAHARFTMGEFYSSGLGVPQDDVQAAQWYRKAAEQGYANAQRAIASCYSEGKGVAKDSVQVFEWYRKAEAQGKTGEQKISGVLNMPQSLVASRPLLKNEALLRKYISEGSLDALNLGRLCDALATILYERGDFIESADLYRRAYDNEYYKYSKDSKGLDNLNKISQRGIIPQGSITAQRIQQVRSRNIAYAERANLTAGWVAFATFIAYHIWVYSSHITGILHDASLFIAGGLAWGTWHFIIHSFENNSRE